MDQRYTGIIRTLPYFGAGEPEEQNSISMAFRRMEGAFKLMETNDEGYVYIAFSQKPKIEVLHCYILVGGKIRVRANISHWIPQGELGDVHCWDGSLRDPKWWAVLTAPISWPKEPIPRRGFQGFRYTEELW